MFDINKKKEKNNKRKSNRYIEYRQIDVEVSMKK